MKKIKKNGATSNIVRVLLLDSTSTTGAGKTGLTSASSGLSISTIASNEATATTYTGANLEAVTTLGTFAAPTSGKARFKEVDATNLPGLYEIQIADARFAVANAKALIVGVTCTGCVPVFAEYQLSSLDVDDSVRAGMTALPNVAAGENGGLPLGDASGRVDLSKILGTALTETSSGYIAAAFKKVFDVATAVFTAASVNQTGDSYARMGAPAGASLSVDIAAVKSDTAAIKAKTDNLPAAPAAVSDIPTAALNAAAVWDLATSGHTTSGTFGAAAVAAGGAGDPWSTSLPGSYGAGTAGKIIGDNIDAAISSRMATFSYTAPDNSGIAAIQAKTDNLPADPADASDIAAAFSVVDNAVAAVASDVTAVKNKTDSLAFTSSGKVDANVLALNGSSTAATNLQKSGEAIGTGTVGSSSTTTSIVTSALSPSAIAADQFKGRIVTFGATTTTTSLRGQSTDITASDTSGVLTVTALTTAPVSGDTFVIT